MALEILNLSMDRAGYICLPIQEICNRCENDFSNILEYKEFIVEAAIYGFMQQKGVRLVLFLVQKLFSLFTMELKLSFIFFRFKQEILAFLNTCEDIETSNKR